MKAYRRNGFSIVELVVALSIMILLVIAVAPSMREWIISKRLSGAAENVMYGIKKSRSLAIKTNMSNSFWLVSPSSSASLDDSCARSSTSPSWVISMDDPSGSCSILPSFQNSPRIFEAHGARIDSDIISVSALNASSSGASRIEFDSFGQVVNQVSAIRSIDFTSTTAGILPLRVEITSSGGVRLCVRSSNVVSPDPRACRS